MRISFLKKAFILASVAGSITIASMGASFAEAPPGPDYLKLIHDDTTAILERINSLPNYITQMLKFVLNMQKEDDSQATRDMQANFAIIGQLMQQDYVKQNSDQLQVMADLTGQPAAGFALPADNPSSVLKEFPNVNDIAYTTMLGLPPASKGVANPYNYLKNASGLSLVHTKPDPNWTGSPSVFKIYSNYYHTVMAIQSFNAYVLSNQYADFQNGNALTNTQLNLVTQASNSDWIASVATEEIGKVLRQLLVFQSQTYVLMTQLVQTQKQMLTAQAMTNAAIIASNFSAENEFVKTAKK